MNELIGTVITLEQYELLKETIKRDLLGELKQKPVKTFRTITELARTAYTDDHEVYGDQFIGGFSFIIRNVFDTKRLDGLYGDKLDQAIELTKELVDVIKKYRKGDDENDESTTNI